MSLTPRLESQLKAIIAVMLMIPEEAITPDTSLVPLNTSLGSARVRLGLKRLGLALPANAKPATFRGLVAALGTESAPPPSPAPTQSPASVPSSVNGSSDGLNVGLDVEQISALPAAIDYWEDEFYRSTFSKSEIAYAVLQLEPRTHFAGFWCAKEALRKSDPAFKGISPDRTAVAHDAESRPYLTLDSNGVIQRLPHAVSISHTSETATAVVVATPSSQPAKPQANRISDPTPSPNGSRKSRGLAKLFGI
jgi:phosphopantetheine--protein transferase-like protein